MKKLDNWELGKLKEGQLYWVFDASRSEVVLSRHSSGKFYYYDVHDPYGLQITNATHYKRIRIPKL